MSECELQTVCSQVRIRKYVTVEKAKLLGDAFIDNNIFVDSRFSYAPLIWMFYQKTLLYLKIEKIHHKMLKIIRQSNASYRDLPE